MAEGFNPNVRVENAATVRLTDSGIQFLEDNLDKLAVLLQPDPMGIDAGIIKLPIPEASGDFSVAGFPLVTYSLCPGGGDPDTNTCIIELDLGNADLEMNSEDDHHIRISGALPVRAQNIPIEYTPLFIPLNVTAVINGNADGEKCNNPQAFADLDLTAVISIEIDTDDTHARHGYSRLRIEELSIDGDQLAAALDFCGSIDADILEGLTDVLLPLLTDTVVDQAKGQMEDALCQAANETATPQCPLGATNVNGVCRYGSNASDDCMPVLLGTDALLDAGQLLAAFSPGTQGKLEFLMALGGHSPRDDASGFAWGDLNPIADGATFGLYGGAEPNELTGCVPLSDLELPVGIPVPDELNANTVAGWPEATPGPHAGIALSERFTNYALAQFYNAGALCLGITGETIPELSSALIGAGIGAPSMKELSHLGQPSQVAIVVRPQSPPTIEFGNGTDLATDPLLLVEMKQLSFDFYVWSLDRFVRAMTATFDVTVPANLEVTPDGLLPVLEDLDVSNGVVTNSQLLREDPEKVAAALEGLLGGIVGSFLGGSFSAIDLNSALGGFGIGLVIPPTVEGQGSPGLRKLTKASDDFLGIFAALEIPDPPMMKASTDAEILAVEVDPAGLYPATFDGSNGPRVTLRLDADHSDVEWQYRLDSMPWRPFSRERNIVIDHPWLRAQAKHTVEVRARRIGAPHSLDATPTRVDFIIDVEPPLIEIDEGEIGDVSVRVGDRVSDNGQLKARVRLGGAEGWNAWSEWTAVDELAPFMPDDASVVEVEAIDEEGNVGTVTQALIRGRGQGGDCQCTTPGGRVFSGVPQLLLFAMALGAAALRRRRRD